MTKPMTIRIENELLADMDRERRRRRVSRSDVVREGIHLWLDRLRTEEAIRLDREGYEKHPIREDEFGPVLRAQRWPK
jgi:Arc/MetJ-type ribon-helix-helix transcriptional regulator